MILLMDKRRARLPKKSAVGGAPRGRRRQLAPAPLAELRRVDQEIASLALIARSLADELGALFAEYRAACRRGGEGPAAGGEIMIMLSKMTDDCIDRIYALESRRRDLLGGTAP
jgi:hypothetical protein